jgi:hypothetical protein
VGLLEVELVAGAVQGERQRLVRLRTVDVVGQCHDGGSLKGALVTAVGERVGEDLMQAQAVGVAGAEGQQALLQRDDLAQPTAGGTRRLAGRPEELNAAEFVQPSLIAACPARPPCEGEPVKCDSRSSNTTALTDRGIPRTVSLDVGTR